MAKYTIYEDFNNHGESYTVYRTSDNKHIGVFLADDPALQEYIADGVVEDGFDNRTYDL